MPLAHGELRLHPCRHRRRRDVGDLPLHHHRNPCRTQNRRRTINETALGYDIDYQDDVPTEMYQLGIRYPDGEIVWGNPVLRAEDAKAQGYYIDEIGDLHRHYRARIAEAHAPAPVVWPQFVYRFVTLTFSATKPVL